MINYTSNEKQNNIHDKINNELQNFLKNYPQFFKEKSFKKREIIFREDDKGNKVYILLSGLVVGYKTMQDGQKRILNFSSSNSILGNVSLTDYSLYNMTAEAIIPSRCLEIDNFSIKEVVTENPIFFWYLYEDTVYKLRGANKIIEESYLSAAQKIAKGLIHMSQQFGYKTENGIEIRTNFTQEYLAQYTGTTRVTVAKVFATLNQQGIINSKSKPWIIKRLNELINFS
ncbi:CRP-like cAMP-binding protein [Neobacillus niacini]|uniref:Crp/Fnr family transcriptional regulator n=1 Tax=Neobacillus niacini TaxID=86668 RepID=UPI00285AC186|nr:Crp/Fnr family transcriptional regulator [Neobacillus niacini]MDR7080217.1 CRP-like cAMP-binding protein [Neobacillus niacini]